MLRISKPRGRIASTVHNHGADVRVGADGSPDVAGNLRRLRQRQGHSLETLAKLSGVSRAMLGQIETGKSAPTITLLWKVAQALGAPIADLISNHSAPRGSVLRNQKLRTATLGGGLVQLRSYSPAGSGLDISELRLAPGHRESFAALATPLQATLIVNKGTIAVEINGNPPETLATGDAILFEPNHEHSFSNAGADDAVAYLIIAPLRTAGGR